VVHLLFVIPPPHTIDDLFNRWSEVGSGNQNTLMLIAAAALVGQSGSREMKW